MPLDAVAAVLLLLCGLSAADVPAPTNVAVSCNSSRTTVTWTYSEEKRTRFQVHVIGSDEDRRYVTETLQHHLDFSRFVWESMENSMDIYYVTVTALDGGNRSDAVKSESFSFNPLKMRAVKCFLDFPPVKLSVEESGATVSFLNPLSFYKLKNLIKQDDVSFKYTVLMGNETYETSCTATDVCRYYFTFAEGEEQSVTLKGRLCNRDCLGEVGFKPRDAERMSAPRDAEQISPDVTKSSNVLVITLVLMISVLVFVIVVVTTCICKEKAWTMAVDKVPECLDDFPDDKMPTRHLLQPGGHCEDTVMVTLSQSVTSIVDSLEDEDEDCAGSSLYAGKELCCQSGEEGYRDGGLSEDSNQSSGCGACGSVGGSTVSSEETECVSISSEDRCNEGYDRPHCLLDGDDDGDD